MLLKPQPLLHLLGAKSPKAVDAIFIDIFRYRHDGVSEQKQQGWNAALGGALSQDDLQELAASGLALIQMALYDNLDKAGVAGLFPADFHGALKGLLSKVVCAHLAEWRTVVLSSQVSAPKLVDFDWRVDVKRSSNFLSHMSVPTVLLDIKVQKPIRQKGQMPGVAHHQLELSKEALNTMLDGLTKIGANADPNTMPTSALMWCARWSAREPSALTMRWLIQEGQAEVDLANSSRKTAIMHAAMVGNLEGMKMWGGHHYHRRGGLERSDVCRETQPALGR